MPDHLGRGVPVGADVVLGRLLALLARLDHHLGRVRYPALDLGLFGQGFRRRLVRPLVQFALGQVTQVLAWLRLDPVGVFLGFRLLAEPHFGLEFVELALILLRGRHGAAGGEPVLVGDDLHLLFRRQIGHFLGLEESGVGSGLGLGRHHEAELSEQRPIEGGQGVDIPFLGLCQYPVLLLLELLPFPDAFEEPLDTGVALELLVQLIVDDLGQCLGLFGKVRFELGPARWLRRQVLSLLEHRCVRHGQAGELHERSTFRVGEHVGVGEHELEVLPAVLPGLRGLAGEAFAAAGAADHACPGSRLPIGARPSLLDDVRQLVGQQPLPRGAARVVAGGRHEDVAAVGKGLGVDLLADLRGARSGVDAHAGKVRAETRLHVAGHLRRQGGAPRPLQVDAALHVASGFELAAGARCLCGRQPR